MHRFFLPPEECNGGTLRLSERDCRHAGLVLRLIPGHLIEVLDGAGRVLTCELIDVHQRSVSATVRESRVLPPPSPITLAPAVLKGRAMNVLLQKVSELGAIAISPIVTDRTIVHMASTEWEERMADWRLTMIEACKQSGNPWLARVGTPQSLDAFLARDFSGLRAAAMLRSDARLPSDVMALFGRICPPVTLFIGPEGDFTPEEQDRMVAAGVVPVTLGPWVLRAETAAIAGLALFQQEFMRRAPVV